MYLYTAVATTGSPSLSNLDTLLLLLHTPPTLQCLTKTPDLHCTTVDLTIVPHQPQFNRSTPKVAL